MKWYHTSKISPELSVPFGSLIKTGYRTKEATSFVVMGSKYRCDISNRNFDITHKREPNFPTCASLIYTAIIDREILEENETRCPAKKTCVKYSHWQTIGTKCRRHETQSKNCWATGGCENQSDSKALFNKENQVQNLCNTKNPQIFVFSLRTKNTLLIAMGGHNLSLIYFLNDWYLLQVFEYLLKWKWSSRFQV